MVNLSIIEIENESLRYRLKTIKAEVVEFVELVGRYVEPKKGETYCSRNELLLAKEHLKKLLK